MMEGKHFVFENAPACVAVALAYTHSMIIITMSRRAGANTPWTISRNFEGQKTLTGGIEETTQRDEQKRKSTGVCVCVGG